MSEKRSRPKPKGIQPLTIEEFADSPQVRSINTLLAYYYPEAQALIAAKSSPEPAAESREDEDAR